MSVIAIETALLHLRADADESEAIQLYLDAAEDSASTYLQRKFYADQAALDAAVADLTAGESPIVINPSIIAACLLILGHLFEHREDVIIGATTAKLPRGSEHLLFPYRIGLGV